MQKSPADDFSVGWGCDFVPPRSFAEGLDPVGDFLLRDGGGEALALLPVAGAGERRELRAALADAAPVFDCVWLSSCPLPAPHPANIPTIRIHTVININPRFLIGNDLLHLI